MENKKMSLMLVKNGLAETAERIPNERHSPGEIVVFLANLKQSNNDHERIVKCLEENLNARDVASYFKATLEELQNAISSFVFARIILMDIYNKYMGELSEQCKITLEEVVSELKSNTDDICWMARAMLSMDERFSGPRNENALPHEWSVAELYGSFLGEVSYEVGAELDENDEVHFYDKYLFNTALSAIFFDYVEIARRNIVIKKCENCGKYFIPTTRKDEKYCDNIFRDNKSCKQLGYEIKVNSDEVLKTYRKVYKTQNARKQRNKNNCKDIESRFKSWSNYAKTELERCKNGEIDLKTFENNIDKTDWLRGE